MAWLTEIGVADSRTVKNDDVNHKCERGIKLSFNAGEVKADDKPLISKWIREAGELVKAEIDLCMKGITPEVKGKDSEKPNPTNEKATEKQLDLIRKLLAEKKIDGQEVLTHYEVEDITLLTKEQASGAIKLLKEKK